MKKLLSLTSLALFAAATYAQQGYALRKTDIRAAYLHLNGDHAQTGAGASETAPHVWYNLDSNASLKPAGWNFVNPLAPGWLDDSERPFFLARYGDTPVATTRVSKRDTRYWWLNVSELSDDDFAQLDVALLQVTTTNLTVNPSDREKLRRFVDKGGVLWIDYTYGSLEQTQGGPISVRATATGNTNVRWDPQTPILRYPNALTSNEIGLVATGPTYAIQPILTQGFMVPDVTGSGMGNLMNSILAGGGGVGDYGKNKFITATGGASVPTAMLARIGDGYLISTSRGLSEAINRVGNGVTSPNRNYYAIDPGIQTARPSGLDAVATAASKFIFNAISLAAESTHGGAGSRKNYSNFIDVGAPLLQTWAARYGTLSTGASDTTADIRTYRPPVIFKGMVFSVTDERVYCYGGDAKADADRDGILDDGVPDFSLGNEEDLIFATAPVATKISSAVCVEVPNPNGGVPQDQLLVATGDGRLLVYPIFDPVSRRCSASETLAPIASISPGVGGTAALESAIDFPMAPTVHEGIAYVTDTINNAGNYTGRVWQADLRTLLPVRTTAVGTGAYVFGGTANAIQKPSSSPTVGYIPIMDNSGGMDKVMYMPLAPQNSPPSNAGFMSIWLGAKGERPSSVSESGGVVQIVTRAATQGGLPIHTGPAGDALSLRVSLVRTNGTVYTPAELNAYFDGNASQNQGTISLTLDPMVSWPPGDIDPENGVRVDYTIDWGASFPASSASIERGRLLFPSPNIEARRVVDGIALSPSGTAYITSSTQKTGSALSSINNDHLGSLYSIREEGRGIFRMVYRWDLYPDHRFAHSGGTTSVPSVLPDNDPVQYLQFGAITLDTFLGGSFRASAFQGSPVVRNGEVYVTVSGFKRQAPASALLCFRDETAAREIRLGRPVGREIALVQPDFSRSNDATAPNTFSVLTAGNIRIEQEPGNVGQTLRLDSMMDTQRGQLINSLNTSQPLILRETGQPDRVIDPAQQGDRWNPLKWYAIMHGVTLRSAAYASGRTLFVSGSSVLPRILEDVSAGIFPPTIADEGYVTAFNGDFDPNTAVRASQSYTTVAAGFNPRTVVADDTRPYMKQLITMDYPRAAASWTAPQQSLASIYPSQQYAWPQVVQNSLTRGVMTFEDFLIRLNQCTLRAGTSPGSRSTSYGVVGGEGFLVAWNAEGTFCFKRAHTWVADEGRISQFDPSGNTIFDSTVQSVTGSTGGNTSGSLTTMFARPTRIYPVDGSDDLLVVDSDQSRVLRMTPNGSVIRSLNEFSLDTTFAPPGYKSGDSLKLNNPRDASTYVSEVLAANNPFSTPRALEYWVHYLVADQGNQRMVEVVDRYEMDAASGNIISRISEGTLLWHSPTAISGKGFGYNSLTRLQIGAGRFVVVAGVGGKAPTRAESGEPNTGAVIGDQGAPGRESNTGNGGIVVFDSTLPGGYRVFNSFETPEVDGTRIWDFNTSAWGVSPANTKAVRSRVMSNLQAVTASLIPPATAGGAPRLAMMISDGTGMYEVEASATDPTVLTTRWMLPNWAFNAMRRSGLAGAPSTSNPNGFFPTYARRLDSDNVILVNGYLGKKQDNVTTYRGEVMQVDGRIDPVGSLRPIGDTSYGFSVYNVNLGFSTRSIKMLYGPTEGSRGLVLPIFADRR